MAALLHRDGPAIDWHLTEVVVTARQECGPPLPRDIGSEARALLDAKVRAMAKADEQRGRHVTEDDADRGLVVDLRTSKTWPRVVQVPHGSRAHLCPVRAWRKRPMP